MNKENPFKSIGEKVAEKLFENGLCLPSGSNLSEEDLGEGGGMCEGNGEW